VKLNIKERLLMAGLYPQKGNLIAQTLVKDISERVRLTQEEIKKLNFRSENNLYRWDEDKVGEKEFILTETELNFLREQVSRLDKENAVNQDLLPLCLKIKG